MQASTHIGDDDCVLLDGEPIIEPSPIYWMLNKPTGVVCANKDSEHPTVFDLMNTSSLPHALRDKLQIAGRLDRETTGLVLITSDGDWNHRVTSPNKSLGKRYRVMLADELRHDAIKIIEEGILLRNEKAPCKPAKLTQIASHECLLEITEGKYHQVKRMFAATNNRVVALHREAIAGITLDSTLQHGEHRTLSSEEIHFIG